MTTREKMINYRKENNLSLISLSLASGVSVHLLELVENGNVTHPSIAEKIRKAYKLTRKDAEDLMPKNQRKSSDEFEPDKYRLPDDYKKVKPIHKKVSEIDAYLKERSESKGRFKD